MKDLDDDSVSRQVHSPGQGGGTDQDLEVASGEHALHQAAVRAQHASVVDAKTFRKHFFHLLVPGALDLKETVKEGVSEGVEASLRLSAVSVHIKQQQQSGIKHFLYSTCSNQPLAAYYSRV